MLTGPINPGTFLRSTQPPGEAILNPQPPQQSYGVLQKVPWIKKFRLPFRGDNLFGILFLMFLSVPLAFTLSSRENFETVKYALWLVFIGSALAVIAFRIKKGQIEAGENEGFSFLLNKPFFVFLSLFFIWLIVSTVFSPDKLNSVFGFYHRFDNSLLFYGTWAILIAIILSAGKRQYIEWLLKILVFDASAIAVYALFQSQGFAFYDGLDAAGILRSPSFLGNPIFSSMFIASALPFVFYFWHKARTFFTKIYFGTAVFFILSAIMALASRGVWLAVLFGFVLMLVVAVLYSRKKKIFIYSCLGVLAAVLIFSGFARTWGPQSGRLILSLSDENVSTRLYAWEMARQAIIKSPLTGVGLGDFQQFFEQNRAQFLSNATQIFDDPHNLFLLIAATGGLPLLIFFVGCIAVAFFYGVSEFKKTQNYLALACICSLVIFCGAASFTPVVIPCFLLLTAVLACLISFKAKPLVVNFPSRFKIPLLFAAIFFIYAGVCLIVAEHLFYFAVIDYYSGDYIRAQKLSRLAIALNPTNQQYYLHNIGSKVLSDPQNPEIPKNLEVLKSLHPKAANTYSMLATLNFLLFLKTNQQAYMEKAVDNINASLAIDPYSQPRRARLGYFYLYWNKIDMAEAATKSAISLDRSFLAGWIQLAKIYQIENKKPQLVEVLETAFKLRPDIIDLKVLLKQAKDAKDIQTLQIPLPPEQGSLE